MRRLRVWGMRSDGVGARRQTAWSIFRPEGTDPIAAVDRLQVVTDKVRRSAVEHPCERRAPAHMQGRRRGEFRKPLSKDGACDGAISKGDDAKTDVGVVWTQHIGPVTGTLAPHFSQRRGGGRTRPAFLHRDILPGCADKASGKQSDPLLGRVAFRRGMLKIVSPQKISDVRPRRRI